MGSHNSDEILTLHVKLWRGTEFGGIAQLVERLVRNEKARGSNPLTSNPKALGAFAPKVAAVVKSSKSGSRTALYTPDPPVRNFGLDPY